MDYKSEYQRALKRRDEAKQVNEQLLIKLKEKIAQLDVETQQLSQSSSEIEAFLSSLEVPEMTTTVPAPKIKPVVIPVKKLLVKGKNQKEDLPTKNPEQLIAEIVNDIESKD